MVILLRKAFFAMAVLMSFSGGAIASTGQNIPSISEKNPHLKQAQEYAEVSCFPLDKVSGRCVITKWSEPLQITIQDSYGKDLDLSKMPGRTIKEYLDALVERSHIPLFISKADKKNNNVSVVVAMSGFTERNDIENAKMKISDEIIKTGDSGLMTEFYTNQDSAVTSLSVNAGRIWGVPMLDEASRLFGDLAKQSSAWSGHEFIEYDNELPDSYGKVFRVGHDIKACKILLFTDSIPMHGWARNAVFVSSELSDAMLECLGKRYANPTGGKIEANPWQYLSLLYNPLLKAGTKPEEATRIFLGLLDPPQ